MPKSLPYPRKPLVVCFLLWGIGLSLPRSYAESPQEALLEACEVGDTELANQALKAGANPSCQREGAEGVETPLGLAISHGYTQIASVLINRGAEAWPTFNNWRHTPGSLAIQKDSPLTPGLMSQLSEKPPMGLIEVLAEQLASRGDVEDVKGLVKYGLRPEHVTAAGGTPFLWALTNGHVEAAGALLDWSAPRMVRRFEKNLDARFLIMGLAKRPWLEMAAVGMLDKMYGIGIQFFVPPMAEEASPGALASRYRLPRLAVKLGWTGTPSQPLGKGDHAVLAVGQPDGDLRTKLYEAALEEGSEKAGPLSSRILANLFSITTPFPHAEAKLWLERGADLNALVDIPFLGKMTATGITLKSGVNEAELSARLQWLQEKGAKLFNNLRISQQTPLSAVKSLYHWSGGASTVENESVLANLILWNAEDRHWGRPLRQLVQFLVEQKATLGGSPLSLEALSVLAKRPEPRILANVDSAKKYADLVKNFQAKSTSKFLGHYQSSRQDTFSGIILEADGQATLESGENPIYGTWQEDGEHAAQVTTPVRSYSLHLTPQDHLEIRLIRYQHQADMVMGRIVDKKAETVLSDTKRTVLFRESKLDALPETAETWEHVQRVDASGNRLRTLPFEMLRQPSLVSLDLHDNWLSNLSLPVVLNQLEMLNLSGNGFKAEFAWANKLPGLITLQMDDNCLSEFPAPLERLSKLAELSISGNRLKVLPSQIMVTLPSLRVLKVARNRITSLPPELLQSPLSYLDLEQNTLDYETLRGSITIGKINVMGNNFSTNQLASLTRRYPHVIWVSELNKAVAVGSKM